MGLNPDHHKKININHLLANEKRKTLHPFIFFIKSESDSEVYLWTKRKYNFFFLNTYMREKDLYFYSFYMYI